MAKIKKRVVKKRVPKEGSLLLMRVEVNGDREDVQNFILGFVDEALPMPDDELEVRLKKVLWSDYKGWRTRVKNDKVPFSLGLPWVCEKGNYWVVKDEDAAQAIVLGAKL